MINKLNFKSFKIKTALIAITAACAVNTYNATADVLTQHNKKQAMKQITQEDRKILYDIGAIFYYCCQY